MIAGSNRIASPLAVQLIALWFLAPVAVHAAEEAETPDPFDPRRPPAAELQLSVAEGFTLAAVGDCIISRPLSHKRASDAEFDAAVKILLGTDATFGNLETAILAVRNFDGYPDSGS
ncbi:MAG: CapA family protein, partial [Deltaproteobacteria bacterium]|nr:CapA family protein [Deltaproteobacteria bacterium]